MSASAAEGGYGATSPKREGSRREGGRRCKVLVLVRGAVGAVPELATFALTPPGTGNVLSNLTVEDVDITS